MDDSHVVAIHSTTLSGICLPSFAGIHLKRSPRMSNGPCLPQVTKLIPACLQTGLLLLGLGSLKEYGTRTLDSCWPRIILVLPICANQAVTRSQHSIFSNRLQFSTPLQNNEKTYACQNHNSSGSSGSTRSSSVAGLAPEEACATFTSWPTTAASAGKCTRSPGQGKPRISTLAQA